MKTRTIRRYFVSAKAASQNQWRLYDRYDCVHLVEWPQFKEDGYYAWQVAGDRKPTNRRRR